MPITSADISYKLSINTGPGNSAAQGNVNDSIGGWMSSTQLSVTPTNNLFDDVTGEENALFKQDFRCIFIHNNHPTLAVLQPKLWMSGLRFTADPSDVFTSPAHGLANGISVRFTREKPPTDLMPTPIAENTTYFVRDVTTNTFKVATTLGGAAVNLTTAGKGNVRRQGGANDYLYPDPLGVVPANSAAAQAERIATENTPPAVYSNMQIPFSKNTGFSLPNITPQSCIGIWILRWQTNSAPFDIDSLYLQVEGDQTF